MLLLFSFFFFFFFTGNDVQADENLTKDTTSTPATISTGT
jgi:hypothetical protein